MNSWILWLIVGILSIAAGIFALANPFAATLTAELLAGYMFLLIGILTMLSAVQDQGWKSRIWALLLGAVITVLGVNLLAHPLQGIVALTVTVAVLMVMSGVFRVALAFTPAAANARLPLLISGALSLLLAVMIFSNFPFSTLVVLGIFLGVELISNGISLIFISLDRRRAEPA